MQYEAILVDLDGVIRHWQPSDESIETAFSLPAGSIRRAAFSPEIVDLAITGAIADEEWRERIAGKLRFQSSATHARQAVALWTEQPCAIDQKVLSLLKDCESSIKLVLVTNATSRLQRDLQALGLLEFFHAVVNSSQVGAKKPSEQIFRAALAQAGTVPERALFIDDTPSNIAAATSFGILSHAFVSHIELSSFLRQAGVLRVKAL